MNYIWIGFLISLGVLGGLLFALFTFVLMFILFVWIVAKLDI